MAVVVALTLGVIGVGLHRSGTPHVPAAGAAPRTQRTQPVAAAGGTSVRFSFDGGPDALAVAGPGQPALAVRSAEGGQVTGVPHGSGEALAFPARCAEYGAEDCPRAVLEALDSANLNPGPRTLRWGASVLLAADQTTPGSNLVQKGFSTGSGQFKLQVDGVAGRPSCVLVGSAGPTIYLAKAAVSVADGAWHTVVCDRSGPLLTVAVDGVEQGHAQVPADLSVDCQDTLRIGGKGTSPNNDQFSGALDDVFVDIGP